MTKMDKSGNNCAGGHLAATYARKETYLPLRFFTTLLVMMLTAVCMMGQEIGGQAPNLSVTLKSGLDNVPGSVINTVEDATIWHGSITDVSSVPNEHFYSTADNPTQYWFKVSDNRFTTPAGYRFTGWKYGNNTYQPGQSIQMTSSSITLTAQWEPIPPYALLQPGTAGDSSVEGNTVIIDNSSSYGSISDDGDGVANGQFYTDSDNRIWFKAANNAFTAPEGYHFAGWKYGDNTYQPGQSIQMPSSGSIILTAQWTDVPYYSLSPTAYTLEGGGYTDIPCTLTEFANGIINGHETEYVGFDMNGGTLTDGKGHSISFLVDDKFHFGAAERKDQGNEFWSAGATFIMAIYINPNDYNQAVPGTYTGTFTYESKWAANPKNYPGESGSMTLTLVVPESPDKIDLEAHAATLNGVSRYWTTFYHGRSAYQLPAGAQAFYMKEDKSLYLVGTDGSVIPSDCAVIIMSDNASIRLTKLDSTTVTKPGNNKLEGKAAQTTVSSLGLNEGENVYVMNMSDGGELGFYEFSGTTIPANKAYFIAR